MKGYEGFFAGRLIKNLQKVGIELKRAQKNAAKAGMDDGRLPRLIREIESIERRIWEAIP